MKTNTQIAVPASQHGSIQTGENNNAENAPKWESQTPQGQESGRIVEVTFTPADTRKRESFAPPRRQRNAERRSREFLTPAEVESVITAAEKQGRHGHRDATLLLIAYRHALRVSELVALRWDQIDLSQG